MRARIMLAIGLMIALVGLTTTTTQAAVAKDMDCGDFDSQAAAQNYFENNGGGPNNNVDNLDADGDGIACESNPCPCSNGGGGGGGGDGDGGGNPGPQTIKQKAKIIRLIDGDTVKVKLTATGRKADVRLIGLDTPELSKCGGNRAKKEAKKILPVGTRVLLVSDATQPVKDRYGRLLRYVMRRATDVSKAQLARGMAKVLVVGKPFKRIKPYRAAQAQADKNNLGNWADCYK